MKRGLPQLERGCFCCSLEAFGYIIGGFNVVLSMVSNALIILFLILLAKGETSISQVTKKIAEETSHAKTGLLNNKRVEN